MRFYDAKIYFCNPLQFAKLNLLMNEKMPPYLFRLLANSGAPGHFFYSLGNF
ncbi:MAG: hypothetical protein G01um101420_500 [Parcubacteria group bacterium Gr01-1014_20]|nr:MAG: hypothetical protein G01um101420_500 [Parcubacteria group bacterium Gr01-1014_20]